MTTPHLTVFVAVGTHEQPFQFLLDACAVLLQDSHLTVRVQYGVGHWTHPAERADAYLSATDMAQAFEWADVCVSQASPGLLFAALQQHCWPIVMPRRHSRGEHVDDHQVHFADAVARLGMATAIQSGSELRGALDLELTRDPAERTQTIDQLLESSAKRTAAFQQRIAQLAQSWPWAGSSA